MKDLGTAFSFPFKDRDWISKFLLGALFMLLCIFVVGIFILSGYFVQITQRVIRREQDPLPDWSDIGTKLVLGFKYFLVTAIYLLPVILLYAIYLALVIISGVASEGDGDTAIAGFSAIFMLLVFLIVIPYALLYTALSPIIAYRFAATESIVEALDIGAVFRDLKLNWANTLVVALIVVGVGSFAGIGFFACVVGVFFTIFYSYSVSAHLYGQLYLDLYDRQNPPAQTVPPAV